MSVAAWIEVSLCLYSFFLMFEEIFSNVHDADKRSLVSAAP